MSGLLLSAWSLTHQSHETVSALCQGFQVGSLVTRHAILHVLKAGIEKCQILPLLLSHDAQVQSETLIELSKAAWQTTMRCQQL